MVSKLFSRSLVAIPMQTYGLPLDMLLLLLQRSAPMPADTTTRSILYAQLAVGAARQRHEPRRRARHNVGCLAVSKALAQLFCDVPLPTACPSSRSTPSAPRPPSSCSTFRRGPGLRAAVAVHGQRPAAPPAPVLERRAHPLPHVEHFALTADPFAHVGVLRAARETLETRFCGGVFVMSPSSTASSRAAANGAPAAAPNTTTNSHARGAAALSGISMAHYLAALFPTQMGVSPRGGGRHSVLYDDVMAIDRDRGREARVRRAWPSLRAACGVAGLGA